MRPDVFGSVHKGIRKSLFELCLALGRAGEDPAQAEAARQKAREVLRFVRHHGENEDLLLLPLLEPRDPSAAARLAAGHSDVEAALGDLEEAVGAWEGGAAASFDLYHRACAFTASYLNHMREEELELLPLIQAALSPDDLAEFSRRAVERTAPADQQMMLGYMLPAMVREDAEAFLARVPPAAAERLRPLLE